MEYEFEGRTEEEAIELAARELGLARDEFDVEILESQRGGFLKKGKTRIKVHTLDRQQPMEQAAPRMRAATGEFESEIVEFTRNVVEKMGYSCSVSERCLFRSQTGNME